MALLHMAKGLKFVFLGSLGLVVLYTILGFLAVPWAIINKLPAILTEQLNRSVSIQTATFNPFLFTLQVNGFAIQETDGSPLAGFDDLFVDFEALSSLGDQTYVFDQVRLGLPYGLVIIRPDGTLNLTTLGKPSYEEPRLNTSVQEPAEPLLVFIQSIQIQQGIIEFQDVSRPTPFVAHVVPINLTLEKFSTQKGKASPYFFSAELSDGERISWEGRFTLDPFGSDGLLTLKKIRLDTLWAYAQDQFRFQIAQGLLTLNGQNQITTTANGINMQILEGQMMLQDLTIQEMGVADPLISLPLLDINGVSIDMARQLVRIPSITARDARFLGWVNKDGMMNYQTLFAPVQSTTDAVDTISPSTADPKPIKTQDSWTVVIEDLDLDHFTIDVEDRQPTVPARVLIDDLHLHTSHISSMLDQPLPIALSFRLNQTGKADLKGTVAIKPLSVELDMDLRNIALKPFESYLSPFVQFDVGSGTLTLAGQTRYQNTSMTEPMVFFQGGLDVSQLALVDPTQTKPFLKWDNLNLKDLTLAVEPTSVNLNEVTLVNPSISVSFNPDGDLNLTRLFTPLDQEDQATEDTSPVAEDSSEESTASSTPVKVQTVRLDNFNAHVADFSITPNVVTNIEGLSGTIQGLSSEQIAKANVSLQGNVDSYSPIIIEGQINPLSEDAYTDLALSSKDWDLTTVSPYLRKYTGYPITKGKLSLDLAYTLSQNELIGENKILIDQITLGDYVESPDASSLPIPLALALLEDRKGKIDINLPVRGNLNDPDFSYGGIVWQAVVNIITKVATSPFSIVNGLVGGILGDNTDNLQYVAFPPGAIELLPAEQEKLVALGKALADRPRLRLEVTGTADSGIDGLALAEAMLLTQLKKAKFVEQPLSATQGEGSIDQIELTADEKRQYLTRLYVEKFGEPTIAKDHPNLSNKPSKEDERISHLLTVAAMETTLLQDISVDENQLRLLAQRRAQQIRAYIIEQTDIPDNRLFLVEVALSPVIEQELIRSSLALTAR